LPQRSQQELANKARTLLGLAACNKPEQHLTNPHQHDLMLHGWYPTHRGTDLQPCRPARHMYPSISHNRPTIANLAVINAARRNAIYSHSLTPSNHTFRMQRPLDHCFGPAQDPLNRARTKPKTSQRLLVPFPHLRKSSAVLRQKAPLPR
jgi:hypothetical protein